MKKIYFILLLLIFVLTACGTGQGSHTRSDYNVDESYVSTLVTGNNELAFDLLQSVEADDNGNLFISSLSLHMALAMVYNGADRETLTEIGHVLGWDENENLNLAHAVFMNRLLEEKDGIQLDIANSIWLNNLYTFQEDFKDNTEEYYDAEITAIDLSDESAAQINDWVAEKTNDRIEDIVTPPLNPDLVTLLINTIYFDGDWTYPFNPEATEPNDFYLVDGSMIEVDMMWLSEELDYFETDDFQAVMLPYGKEENMNMQIILPKETSTFDSVVRQMTESNWQDWQEQYNKQEGNLTLPTFELEYETTLNETLKHLGMPTAFTNNADFSLMIGETDDILISEVKQKTFLKVDEEGTEAAAATSVEMEIASAPIDEPFQMEINRPFFLFITEAESGAIVFSGYIQNPSLGN